MKKIIAFSGACHSGKTTVIELLSNYYRKHGQAVKVLSEPIRSKICTSISDLRKDPSKYLAVQQYVINTRIEREIEAYLDDTDTIYLIDRPIADSLYYLTFFTDKNNLSIDDITVFTNLFDRTILHAKTAYANIYDNIILMPPIAYKTIDEYRPDYLNLISAMEYDLIKIYNETFLYEYSNINKLIYTEAQYAFDKVLSLTTKK